jgi:hypothetical protein
MSGFPERLPRTGDPGFGVLTLLACASEMKALRSSLRKQNHPGNRNRTSELTRRSREDPSMPKTNTATMQELDAVMGAIERCAPDQATDALDTGRFAEVPWAGREVPIPFFVTHVRSEAAIHRWDLVGDDATSAALLAQPELTAHAVTALGPLLLMGMLAGY